MSEIIKNAYELIKSKYPDLAELKYANIDSAYGKFADKYGTGKNVYFRNKEDALKYALSTHENATPTKYTNNFPEYTLDLEGAGGITNKTIELETPVLANGMLTGTASASGIWICENGKRNLIAIISTLNSDMLEEILELIKNNFGNQCYSETVYIRVNI